MKRYPTKRYREYTDDPEPCTPTEKQQAFLDRHHLQPDRPLDFYEASHTINQYVSNRRQLPPTVNQIKVLKEHGKWREDMDRGEAFDAIKAIYANNPLPPPPKPYGPVPLWMIPPHLRAAAAGKPAPVSQGPQDVESVQDRSEGFDIIKSLQAPPPGPK